MEQLSLSRCFANVSLTRALVDRDTEVINVAARFLTLSPERDALRSSSRSRASIFKVSSSSTRETKSNALAAAARTVLLPSLSSPTAADIITRDPLEDSSAKVAIAALRMESNMSSVCSKATPTASSFAADPTGAILGRTSNIASRTSGCSTSLKGTTAPSVCRLFEKVLQGMRDVRCVHQIASSGMSKAKGTHSWLLALPPAPPIALKTCRTHISVTHTRSH